MTKLCTVTLALLVPALLLSAGQPPNVKMAAPTKAVCVVHPLKDSQAHGIVVFTQKGDHVEISGKIMGLTPGKHGFHIHEFGDCSSPEGMSAGGHFNPDKEKHGGPHARERHVGDLGNIEADDSGNAVIKMTDTLVMLHGPHSVIGRAIIVHAKADDLRTDPTGNAGGRIGCGVIGVAKGAEMAPK
jgi:Cu-Zn family superoxide dismutase